MTLTTQELDRTVAYFEKYVSQAEAFLEDLKCEVCCDRYRSCGYACNRHYLCRECHAKVALCPFCRAPQLGVYPDLWYCGGSSFDFKPLTEAVVRNGISSTANAARFSSPTDYAFWFRSACEAGVTQLGAFRTCPASIKMALRVVADCVNRRSNYPIFSWHMQQHLHFDAARWKIIQDAILARTQASPTLEPEVRRHLRKSLQMLLRKIKEIAGTAGLLYRPA